MGAPPPLLCAAPPALRPFEEADDAEPPGGRAAAWADMLPALLFACRAGSEEVYLNRAWLDETGMPDLQTLARRWRDVTVPGDPCPLRSACGVADGDAVRQTTFRLRAADGCVRWRVARARLARDAAGRPLWWIGTVQEAPGAPAPDDPDAVGADCDALLGLVAHELRSPLNAIRGWAHVLRKSASLPASQSGPLDAIERSVAAQARLIDDLLDGRRMLRGELTLRRTRVPAGALVDEAAESVRPAALQRGQELVVHPVAELWLDADPQRLRQVLVNLLSNAVKFAPSGGRIELRCEARGAGVAIEVRDAGGPASGVAQPTFDPLRPGTGMRNGRRGDPGLGLALARRLVELHDGRLSTTSDGTGRGSTFVVELPARADAPEAPAPLVVVVEDDDEARALLEHLLREQGLRPVSFARAGDAYAHLEGQADAGPQAIVSDIGLPDEDGYSFMRRVHAWYADRHRVAPPALALTAFSGDDARARALDAGFDAHLAKPVDPDALRTTLERLLQSEVGRPVP